jgi:hypothetical protein
MSGKFCRNVDRDSRLNDVVGPEEMQDLKTAHHEYHEAIGEQQHLELVFSEAAQDVGYGVARRNDADADEKDDSAGEPCCQSVDVDDVEQYF